MTNRNSNGSSRNQGSPSKDQEYVEISGAGDNNKGTSYRSKKGSKSENKRQN